MPWRVMLFGVLMLGVLVAAPPTATAQTQITCGASITTNTGLTGDLDCSNYPYDAIHIDADNVTFKLNGYTLTCDSDYGYYGTPYEDDVEGIRATGRNGVKVLGPGKITNCGRAVIFAGGSDNLVQGLYISGNLGGLTFDGGANSTARDNVIVGNFLAGIGTNGSVNIQILENYIAANGGFVAPDQPNVGWGFLNDHASTVTIANNYILGHEKGGIGEVGLSALTAQITNNIILNNGGIDLNLRSTDSVVTGNICEASIPAGLCPYPLPRFPFDPAPKSKGHPR
jgi:hypothetical protein